MGFTARLAMVSTATKNDSETSVLCLEHTLGDLSSALLSVLGSVFTSFPGRNVVASDAGAESGSTLFPLRPAVAKSDAGSGKVCRAMEVRA